jgi:hypothetical protein
MAIPKSSEIIPGSSREMTGQERLNLGAAITVQRPGPAGIR